MIQAVGLVLLAVLAENMVLVRCLGLSQPKSGAFTEDGAWRAGVSITLVMVLTAVAAWLVNRCLLEYFGIEYLRLLAYSLLVPGVIAGLRWLLHSFFPALYRYVQDELSHTLYNCAVMGVAYVITQRNYSLVQTLLYSLAGGVGVLLVLVIFAGMRDQASFENCPKAFRGYPIGLITAGLMALALMGFYGLNVTV